MEGSSAAATNISDITHKTTVSKQKIDYVKLQKMKFIYNAIQGGWNVKKLRGKYIFTKKHHSKKEYFYDNYLKEFIESNIEATIDAKTIEKQ